MFAWREKQKKVISRRSDLLARSDRHGGTDDPDRDGEKIKKAISRGERLLLRGRLAQETLLLTWDSHSGLLDHSVPSY